MAYQPKSYRRFLASSVSAALVASAAAAVPADVQQADAAESFSDVSNDYWASQAIQRLTDEGIINGYPDGTFAPGEDINRGQVAELLVKAFDLNINEDAASSYDDLINESYYTPYAEAVTDAGFLQGREDGTMFAAGMDLTREQMATILVRAFDLVEMSESDAEVADLDEANASHQENIQILADYNITSTEDNMFRPKETVTRAQFATFLDRALNDEEIGDGDGNTGDGSSDDNDSDDNSDESDNDGGSSGGSDDDNEDDNDGGSSGGGGSSDDSDDNDNDSGGSDGGSDDDSSESSSLEEIRNGNGELADYEDLGIEGVTEDNLDGVKEAVSNAEPSGDELTAEDIQNAVDDFIQTALEEIRNGNGDVSDYEAVGVEGVTEDNLSDVNEAVSNATPSGEELTPEEIQDVVDGVETVAARVESWNWNSDNQVEVTFSKGVEAAEEQNGNTDLTADDFTYTPEGSDRDFDITDVEHTAGDSSATITLGGDYSAGDQMSVAEGQIVDEDGNTVGSEESDTFTEEEAALEEIRNGNGDVSDYENIGAEGVTEENLDEVNEAVSNTTPSGDELTQEEIQDAADSVTGENSGDDSGGNDDTTSALEEIRNGNGDVSDYENIGAEGVTEENLDEVNEAVSNTTPSGDELTQQEIQDAVDSVIGQNPGDGSDDENSETDDMIGQVNTNLSNDNNTITISGSTQNMADGEMVDISFTNDANNNQVGNSVTANVYGNQYSTDPVDISGFEPGNYTVTVTSNVYGAAQNSTGFMIEDGTQPDPSPEAPAAPEGITTTAASGDGGNGAISGVDGTMEYKAADAETWTAVPEGQTEISDLPAGDYEVRVAASGDTPAGEITAVTIDGASGDGQQSSISDVSASFDNDEVTVTGSTYNIPAEEQVDISFTGSNGNSVESLATTATVTADDSFSTTTSVYSDVTAGDYTATVTYGDISTEAPAFNIPSNLVAAPEINEQINEQFLTDLLSGGGTVGLDLANGENTLGSDVELQIEMETSGGIVGALNNIGDAVLNPALETLGLDPDFLSPDPIIVNESDDGDVNYEEGTASYTFNDGPLTSILTGVVGLLDTVPLLNASEILGTNIELTPVLTNGEQTQRGESKTINFDQDLIDLIRNNTSS
ncbi:S-layer homology domain-containing protein [Salibacterium halotolerans]|uniref:S-layer homology domain-containing protein n=1 Tax=Salibacterium halotolerans TaxID=1884432 RepID=A0A1I5Y1C9_9BACI|nr:S-layer homology domain-containing protein [Salibacterium halotolerans]SFQ38052.1 S-layer homology domain-containing protein [Salibacterium halotolerans]